MKEIESTMLKMIVTGNLILLVSYFLYLASYLKGIIFPEKKSKNKEKRKGKKHDKSLRNAKRKRT